MNESVINALIQLFALVAGVKEEPETDGGREIVKMYLRGHLSFNLVEKYLASYDVLLKKINTQKNNSKKNKKLAVNSVKILKIIREINVTLNRLEKVVVLYRMIEFINDDEMISAAELDLLVTLANSFTISQEEFRNILHFTTNSLEQVPNPENLIIIDQKTAPPPYIKNKDKYVQDANIDKKFVILYVKSIDGFIFKYCGSLQLRLIGRYIIPDRVYFFDRGSIIRGNGIEPIYETEMSNRFRLSTNKTKIRLVAKDIEFRYKNSHNGLKKVSLELKSGQFVGIMGGSGVGKSTFLNILTGKYPIDAGKITINGYDIHTDKKKLDGLIGYVPQDDLLIEELTVYQNLYYNAKLCFSTYSNQQLDQEVNKILKELGLFDSRNLKVGDPLNKFISGGQRKRLNIALELIRKPSILFVDEPTSGLSSFDSKNVMDLLKQQVLMGKLIVANIHQPSSDIYKLFDKIWILDKGGYPVYQGNPIDAITYFKEINNYINSAEIECPVCGNVNPEEALEIIEEKVVDEYGQYTEERITKPEEWYTLFKVNLEKRGKIKAVKKTKLPKTDFKVPNKFKQFKVFVLRDVLSKISDKQYLLLNLLEAPILALLLSFFSKKVNSQGEYVFAQNINIPIFFFMAVVVALFLGLSVSAEEIIKDRRILEREKFLNLSSFSYLKAKILVLFMLSAYQMLTFVLISESILEIRGMTFRFWLVLFSTATASNLLGLNISSAFKNVITIYILIPLILVPQMLLGGGMIKYEDIYPPLTNQQYVPMIGDLMISRWAYEAIVVEQYKNNEFEKNFFAIDKERREAQYISAYYIPELKMYAKKCQKNVLDGKNAKETKKILRILNNELDKLEKLAELKGFTFDYKEKLVYDQYDDEIAEELIYFLDVLKKSFIKRANLLTKKRDEKYNNLVKKYGKNTLIKLKKDNFNEKLSDFVLDRGRLKMFIIRREQIVRKKDPIFTETASRIGRAHFYASRKYLGNWKIPTFTFDVIVLWLFSGFFFVALYFDWLRRFVEYLGQHQILRAKYIKPFDKK